MLPAALIAAGVVIGLALAAVTAGSWEAGALGLGLAVAGIAGFASTWTPCGYNAIATTAPSTAGTQSQRHWFQRATVYAVAMLIGGLATTLTFAAAGKGLHAVWSGAYLPLATAVGALALAWSLNEAGIAKFPLPGRVWQVPVTWVKGGFYQSAAIFGGILGAGVFTLVPYAGFHIMLAWLFATGNIYAGLAAGGVYATARALGIYFPASCKTAGDVVSLNQALMRTQPLLHQATAVTLATFATYLLLAPHL
jgi:hypothetical protein